MALESLRAAARSAPARELAQGWESIGEESAAERLRRIVLGIAWALKPPRTLGVPAVLYTLARHYLGLGLKPGELPDPERALRCPDGLAGVCTDLGVEMLLAAYARGLFPFGHVGPMKWWAPSARMVLVPSEMHIEKTLRRKLRQRRFRVTFDEDFLGVVRGCAAPRSGRPHLTWLRPDVMRAHLALFAAGHAHSVEVWEADGRLAGGVYGVAVGRVFFTESQFARMRDASKVGFAVLNRHLQTWGFVLNDGKYETAHLRQLGFRLMPRRDFNAALADACAGPGRPGRWQVDAALYPVA